MLCQVGLRTRGEPLGLDADAQSRLLDRVFEGAFEANESELEVLLYRAAAHAQATRPNAWQVLNLGDLLAAGLGSESAEPSTDVHTAHDLARDKLAPC